MCRSGMRHSFVMEKRSEEKSRSWRPGSRWPTDRPRRFAPGAWRSVRSAVSLTSGAATRKRIAVRPSGAGLLVSAAVPAAGPGTLQLILDSGAPSLVVYGMRGTPRSSQRGAGGRRLHSLGGSSRVVHMPSSNVLVGGIRRTLDVFGLDHQPVGPYIHGLLPTRIFNSIYINPGQAFIVIDPVIRR